jgi:hypothetical protein
MEFSRMDNFGLIWIAIPCLVSGILGLAAPEFWAACDEHLLDRFGNPYEAASDPTHIRTASQYVLAAAFMLLAITFVLG